MQAFHKPIGEHAALLGAAILSILFVASCLNGDDSKDGGTGGKKLYGRFKVDLAEQTSFSDPYATLIGRVSDGPSPSTLSWTETAASGSCRLLVPRAPFCDPGCGSASACVADGVCQAYPKGVDVGTVTVKGVKLKSGANTFSMNHLLFNYQPTAGSSLDFPPFAEGGTVTVSAIGDTSGPFSLTAKGIKPLTVQYDSIPLSDGQDATLLWEPKGSAGTSTVFAQVDISHHGGLKGVIECEGPDNGQLVIAGALVTQLKALGMSGFPTVELTRFVSGGNPDLNIELRLESRVVRPVSIPGIVSCIEDADCPSSQTCQQDFKCQ
jgi:hypothetical protein